MVNQTSQSPKTLAFREPAIALSSLTRNHGVATPSRTHCALPRVALGMIYGKEIVRGAAYDARAIRHKSKRGKLDAYACGF